MALPPRLVIVVGTYDGVLGGWEKQLDGSLKLTLASAVHQGSLRSLAMAASASDETPGTLLSCGYDEMLKTHDWVKRLNSSGEVRTPVDFGTPVCSAFAPNTTPPSTHCMVGFSGGKLALYKKRDWSLQHVLAGHEGGVSSLGVHPSGKLALSGGQSDGKLKLWDLTKGRLAYVTNLNRSEARGGRSISIPVVSIVWTKNGSAYGWAYGNHITVRDVDTGKDLLDVELPSRVNQIAIMEGEDGIFVAVACNDGSLPVLAVDDVDNEGVRRAILAIEPVNKVVAGEERFKCIQAIDYGYLVVTATSAGVVSVMDLEGSIKMMMSDETDDDSLSGKISGEDERESDDEEDMELAVDIITSVQLGSGARVTCLTTWCGTAVEEGNMKRKDIGTRDKQRETKASQSKNKDNFKDEIPMDGPTVEKARALVSKAKKIEAKKKKRRIKPKLNKN
mmetsp:Transcript_13776/g.20310  ORF Transcript_13776/g.20310 Transcript_13776/m.20310 type:complete len:448 (-) Transcript_13776:30-1373(-)